MLKRESISKRLRFEVFKRDSFTCQYCGKKAPDVVLHIDHIDPVSNGGRSEILNLITSCYSCNLGKSNIRLSDNSIIMQQRRQLELLQEKREQFTMMLQWRKSLDNLKQEQINSLIEYLEANIPNHYLSETGVSNLKKHLKKHGFEKVLDAINISAEKYLLYNANDELIVESVEEYIKKIGGILSVLGQSPVRQKIHYIKGVLRNRFSNIHEYEIINLLEEYTNALAGKQWSEEEILEDLEKEVLKQSKEQSSLYSFKSQIEHWISDIKSWEDKNGSFSRESMIKEKYKNASTLINDPSETIDYWLYDKYGLFYKLEYLAKIFPNYDKVEFYNQIFNLIIKFIDYVDGHYDITENEFLEEEYFNTKEFCEWYDLSKNFSVLNLRDFSLDKTEMENLLYEIEEVLKEQMAEMLDNFTFVSTLYKRQDIK